MDTAAFGGSLPLLQFRNRFHTDGRSPWTSDRPAARSLPTYRTTQTENKRAHTYIQALSGIGTHDPRFRASEDSSCLRRSGQCDRQMRINIVRKFIPN
jgi:hypothetical protein